MRDRFPLVTVIVPTLGRPEGLKRCLDSIAKQTYPQDRIEPVVLDGEGTVPEKVKQGVLLAGGQYVVFAANDTELDPDCILYAWTDSTSFGKALVSFNEGYLLEDGGNICAHFMVRRDFIARLHKGELFDTDFHHVGVDNWLWAQATRLGQAMRSERARIVHHHFSLGAPMDDVYRKGWGRLQEDRATLERKLAMLNERGRGTP